MSLQDQVQSRWNDQQVQGMFGSMKRYAKDRFGFQEDIHVSSTNEPHTWISRRHTR
jgi:hypothetical protein